MIKKAKGFICILLASLILLSGCGNSKSLLQSNMRVYLDSYYKGNGVTVSISDFTDFEWEQVLIFQYPVSAQDIENAIGVKYEGSLDLTSGMIFVYNQKVVYDEVFKDNYTNLAPFLIYPYDNINADLHYNVFTPETAVFRCEKINSKEQYGYRLYPLSV